MQGARQLGPAGKALLVVLAAACTLAGRAAGAQASATFQVNVNVLAAGAPACGVSSGSSVTLTCTDGTGGGTTTGTTDTGAATQSTQVLVTPMPAQVTDGWTPWLYTGVGPVRTFGSSRAPVTEVYSRNVSIAGQQYLEMTFSW